MTERLRITPRIRQWDSIPTYVIEEAIQTKRGRHVETRWEFVCETGLGRFGLSTANRIVSALRASERKEVA